MALNLDLMFSSATDEWATPQAFFDEMDAEFRFTLDVCALPVSAKCARYFAPEDDGLRRSWSGRCWMNPPYGREIGHWVEKAAREARENSAVEIVVCLLPARTDTRYFHRWIWDVARHQPAPQTEVRFLKGRLKFGDATNSAPFPSMIVVFR